MKFTIIPFLCITASLAASPEAFSKAVVNQTTGIGYDGLSAAWKAAKSDDVLLINSDVTISSVMNPYLKDSGTARKITVQGASPDVKIKLTPNAEDAYRIAFQINTEGENAITLRDITIEGAEGISTTNLIQAQYGTLTLDNVTINGFKSSVTNGAIRLYGSVSASFNNVRFTGSGLPESAPYDINLATSSATTFSGDCSCNVNLNSNTNAITDNGLTNISPINIYVPDGRSSGSIVVHGSTDLTRFTLNTPTPKQLMLAPRGSDLAAIKYTPVIFINHDSNGYSSVGYEAIPGSVLKDNAIILLNEDTEVASTINYNLTVTISSNYTGGGNSRATIYRTGDTNLINATDANSHIILRNIDIDGSKFTDESGNSGYFNFMVANANPGSVTIENVNIRNCHNKTFTNSNKETTTYGFIHNLNNGKWNIKGLTFTNCSVQDDKAMFVIADSDGCSITGDNKLSLRLKSGVSVNADGVTNTTPIKVNTDGAANGDVAFTNCSDPGKFQLTDGNLQLVPNNTGGLSYFNGKEQPEPIQIPPFTQNGGTQELPNLIKVADGESATITFDIPAGVKLEYMITPFMHEKAAAPSAQADGSWTAYGSTPLTVTANQTVNLRAYDANNTWRLPAESYINVLTEETILTGISDAGTYNDSDCAEPVYHTLQGIPVAPEALVPGMYIRRQGSRISKVIIR